MKRLRIFSGLKLTFGLMPVPNVDPLAVPMIWKGAVAAVFKPNSYGSGKTSNIPNPARTAVFPSWKGSHASPMRGSKFFVVGLRRIGLLTPTGPHAVGLEVQFARLVISWKHEGATV